MIRWQEEAQAVGKYLVACARGNADAFAQDEPLHWILVERVLGRAPTATGVAARADAERWNDPSVSANG